MSRETSRARRAHPVARSAAALAVVAIALVASGCRHRQRTPLERGEGIFMRTCAGCHGPDGRGGHPPGFTVLPRDLTEPALQTAVSDEGLRDTIRNGKGQMPPFGAALPEQDVADVILFVRTLRRPPP